MPDIQGPPSMSGHKCYSPIGVFTHPQAGQMLTMPGFNPYQVLRCSSWQHRELLFSRYKMTIGETFLSAFLQVIFEKLFSFGVPVLLKQVLGIQDKTLKQWERNLVVIQALLNDAEQKQIQSQVLEILLKELQDLLYDLEDLLDEFAAVALLDHLKEDAELKVAEDSQHSGSSSSLLQVQSFVAGISRSASEQHCRFRYGLDFSLSINGISQRLDEILSQTKEFSLSVHFTRQHAHSTEVHRSWRESTSLTCEPFVYGRDPEKREIISRLLNEDPSYGNFVVIPIVGKGGIGKTTLAQSVYNDTQQQLIDRFDLKAWVCVSDVFDTKRITTAIINSATERNFGFNNLNEAHQRLKQVLKGKRFLVVLDDIWSEKHDDWCSLQIPFRSGERGSCVIATTRSQNVALNMNPIHSSMIFLDGLSDEDCWRLFLQHAFDDANMAINPHSAPMKEDILRKCQGLPLAAKALGGLLRTKVEDREWQDILSSNSWSLNENGGVMDVLKLSYHYLPSYLKRCFAYCSMFPKDHEFKEEEVILLWMAEGLLGPVKGTLKKQMEDIGHDYCYLVSRSLFEPGRWQCFKMHALINDLAQWAAQDVCLTTDILSSSFKVSGRARHLSFCGTLPPGEDSLIILEKINHLRTFFFFGHVLDTPTKVPNLISKYIRVLSVADMNIEVLPDSIGDLKLLRYLDLSSNFLVELPESISSLCNLQTLSLVGCYLKKLPRNMRYLVKLRHLEMGVSHSLCGMPLGFGKLTNLQTLDNFIVRPGSAHAIRELKNMNFLRKSLTISDLENVVSAEDAGEARLHEKPGLDKLHMEWESFVDRVDDSTKRDVVEQLPPHLSIKECTFKKYRGKLFPKWLGDPSFTCMVVIRLLGCERCESLPPLGQLPSLKKLYVEDMHGIKLIGHEFYGVGCSNPFPTLEILCFKGMNTWEEWSPTRDHKHGFPCLRELAISKCPSLQGSLPFHLPVLQKLDIRKCEQLIVSLPSLQMLHKLRIEICKALSCATTITCSGNIYLYCISEFIGLKGFWVQGLQTLVVTHHEGDGYLAKGVEKHMLIIKNCPKLDSLWPTGYGELHNLADVRIDNCTELIPFLVKDLPSSVNELHLGHFHSLKYNTLVSSSLFTCLGKLHIRSCSSLTTIDQLPATLQELQIQDCGSIISIKKLPLAIQVLELLSCKELRFVEFTESSSSSSYSRQIIVEADMLLPNLRTLNVWLCENLESLPKKMRTSTSLQQLTVNSCPKIRCFPEEGLPHNLTSLSIYGVGIEQPVHEWGLQHLTSLETLDIGECPCLNLVESFPEEGEFPSSLTRLEIKDFTNLKSLSLLPLANLTSLEVKRCPKLESFADYWLPPKLINLWITGCPLLEQQCQRNPLRHALSRIPFPLLSI